MQKVFGHEAIYVVDGGDTSYFGLVGLQSRERALASNKPACVNVLTDPTVTSLATVMFEQALKTE